MWLRQIYFPTLPFVLLGAHIIETYMASGWGVSEIHPPLLLQWEGGSNIYVHPIYTPRNTQFAPENRPSWKETIVHFSGAMLVSGKGIIYNSYKFKGSLSFIPPNKPRLVFLHPPCKRIVHQRWTKAIDADGSGTLHVTELVQAARWCLGCQVVLGVSFNGGFPPKSSILIGFSIINHPFWGTPIFGNPLLFWGSFTTRFVFFLPLKVTGGNVM